MLAFAGGNPKDTENSMTNSNEVTNKIDAIKQLLLTLTWLEMERLATDIEAWRTSTGEDAFNANSPVDGELLSRWAMESDVN